MFFMNNISLHLFSRVFHFICQFFYVKISIVTIAKSIQIKSSVTHNLLEIYYTSIITSPVTAEQWKLVVQWKLAYQLKTGIHGIHAPIWIN